MKHIVLAVITAATIAIGLISCKKTTNPTPGPDPNPSPNTNISIIFGALQPNPQNFTVNAGTLQTITGD